MQAKPKITPHKMRQAMNLIRQCYDQPPTQAGPTCRRNFVGLTKSTWHRMVREELGLRAYRVCNKHKYIFESSFDIRKKAKCCNSFNVKQMKKYFVLNHSSDIKNIVKSLLSAPNVQKKISLSQKSDFFKK